jgi:hypothetical protein
MPVGHKDLFALKFNGFGALWAVSSVRTHKAVIFPVALNGDKGLFVIIGQGLGEIGGAVAKVNDHIGIGTKIKYFSYVFCVSVRIGKNEYCLCHVASSK